MSGCRDDGNRKKEKRKTEASLVRSLRRGQTLFGGCQRRQG